MEQLKHYLGTGLRFEVIDPKFETGEYELSNIDLLGYESLTGINVKQQSAELFHFEDVQFKMRPLSSLTKPITVEGYNGGEPFVPVVELCKMAHGDIYPYLEYDENELDELEVQMIMLCSDLSLLTFDNAELLFRWHFWLFDQSLFGKSLIEIKE